MFTSAAEGRRGFTVGTGASTLVAPGMAPALPLRDGAAFCFGFPPVLLHGPEDSYLCCYLQQA